ncbi:hypothetical protein BDY19DRAFT_927006 [Irpex rosettiformis]|uniref:Uncharacterized protein n=1 Tax=Irpex rosettiformis TaxID=378272 RepID=A0ACB8UEW4_9APHY|nr:hypothetical protein BDY19DRAFT_927006 [Irpex rosettiformis]
MLSPHVTPTLARICQEAALDSVKMWTKQSSLVCFSFQLVFFSHLRQAVSTSRCATQRRRPSFLSLPPRVLLLISALSSTPCLLFLVSYPAILVHIVGECYVSPNYWLSLSGLLQLARYHRPRYPSSSAKSPYNATCVWIMNLDDVGTFRVDFNAGMYVGS